MLKNDHILNLIMEINNRTDRSFIFICKFFDILSNEYHQNLTEVTKIINGYSFAREKVSCYIGIDTLSFNGFLYSTFKQPRATLVDEFLQNIERAKIMLLQNYNSLTCWSTKINPIIDECKIYKIGLYDIFYLICLSEVIEYKGQLYSMYNYIDRSIELFPDECKNDDDYIINLSEDEQLFVTKEIEICNEIQHFDHSSRQETKRIIKMCDEVNAHDADKNKTYLLTRRLIMDLQERFEDAGTKAVDRKLKLFKFDNTPFDPGDIML